jgi:REP element-mobilizing transposase RayT
MVIAHHLLSTAYGWWLPNDPRGSSSSLICCDVIAELGELHQGRKRVQPTGAEIRAFYREAAPVLAHELLTFSPKAVEVIADAFARVIGRERYTCYACAIMSDHVHLTIRKHKHAAEEMIAHLQEESRARLCEAGLRAADHPVWARGGWKVFLDHPDDVWRTIRYVEDNPVKIRRPKQAWGFVKAYDGWPLHAGHSRNSPYVWAMGSGRQREGALNRKR